MTAGETLRAALDAALERERLASGAPSARWDEREQQHIDAACRAAAAVELLDQQIAAARAGECNGSLLVKFLAERRLQDDKVSEHLKWLQLEQFTPLKSPQHAAAANARWGQRPQRGRHGTA